MREGKSNEEIAKLEDMSVSTLRRLITASGLGGIRKHGPRKQSKAKKVKEEPKPPAGRNADRHLCKTCKYRGSGYGHIGCEYAYLQGRIRGCKVEDCTVYERGPRIRRKEDEGK